MSLAYISLGYSVNRNHYLEESLWSSENCKATRILQFERPMWAFKHSDLYVGCHLDRFKHLPKSGQHNALLSILDVGKLYSVPESGDIGIFGEGWSHIEPWGVWSDGRRAELRFLSRATFHSVDMEIKPFVYGRKTAQSIKITSDGSILFDGIIDKRKVIHFPFPQTRNFDPDRIFRVTFELPDARSPAELGPSPDVRELGIGVVSFKLRQ